MTVACIAETGYLAGKAGPYAPDREYSTLGSRLTGGTMLHWPTADEFQNSVPAPLRPLLVWVNFGSLRLTALLILYLKISLH